MKCTNCGAVLADDAVKCPFCKEVLRTVEDPKIDKCDFKYTITSETDMNILRKTLRDSFERKSHRKKKVSFKRISFRRRRRNRSAVNYAGKSIRSGFLSLSPQNRMNVAFFGVIFFIVLLVFSTIFVVKSISNRERTLTPVAYLKNNSMFLNNGGKSVTLTENTLDMNSMPENDGTKKVSELISKETIVRHSENGMYTYYFENYDINSKSGSLVRIFNGKKKQSISTAVHNSFVLSPDGKSVLFLQSADKNGDMGNLCYWCENLEEPIKIAVDIDKNTFGFSYNGNYALYIRNYNYSENGGDLCSFDIKNSAIESIVLDTGVMNVFGTDKSEKQIIYSKSVENSGKIYDLYVKTHDSDCVKLFEKAVKNPIISEISDEMLVYAYNDDKLCSLYNVNIKNQKSTKIASQMTTVIKTSDDFKKIVYNKIYDNNTIDCYVYINGQKTLKLAENIKMVSSGFENANQFSFSDDFMNAVYISGFDAERCGGKMYMSTVKNGEVTAVDIADDVYTCRMSPDGKSIIFGKDFSKAREIFDLYLYKNENSILLEESVEKSFFGITGDRENLVFINDFDPNGFYGTLNIINTKGTVLNTTEKSGAFSCVGENGVVYFGDYSDDDNSWSVYFSNGKKQKLIDTGVDGLLK